MGQTITSSTQFGDNFDNYAKKIIDKVGLTLYNNRQFTRGGLDLIRYGMPYASVVEKIRVTIGDFEANKAWKIADSGDDFSDIFNFAPVDLKATYYNKAVTFRKKISLPEYQMRSAFHSAENMVRLFTAIVMAIQSKFKVATNALEKFLITNRIAENVNKSSKNVINLIDRYQDASGETVTAETALNNKEFLRFASYQIGVTKTLMMEESSLFNESDFITHADDDMKMVFLTDFAKALEANLYGGEFRDEYVKQSGYSEVGFWQAMQTGATFAQRSSINVKPASDNTKTVTQSGILAVLFSPDACFIAGEQPYTTALTNPDGDFVNYWYKWRASYYNDLAENFVVFTLADGESV